MNANMRVGNLCATVSVREFLSPFTVLQRCPFHCCFLCRISTVLMVRDSRCDIRILHKYSTFVVCLLCICDAFCRVHML